MQPAICEDIYANLYRLLNTFTQLQQAPNTSFSHHNGFQQVPSAYEPMSDPTTQQGFEQIASWLLIASLLLYLIWGQSTRMRENLKPLR